MAAEPTKEHVDVADTEPVTSSTDNEEKTKQKKKKGFFSRMWNIVFRSKKDDFEKRLQHISKEEASVISRINKRSQNWRRMTRHLVILSVLFEVIAVGYAVMTTRSLELNWKMRALRVLPMFLLPGLSIITYSAIGSFTRMCERKDQKTLEKLRAERQAKIEELKEKTNYYITQQLIQRYDPDPAAKAAAASVLAYKLGTDTGLKVYVGDESKHNVPTGKSNDVEVAQSTGLRNRKQARSSSKETAVVDHHESEMLQHTQLEGSDMMQHQQTVVEHFNPTGSSSQDGGWLARIAALLVGEDPTQSYALICGNCHMHNGLARKEDFPYITYYCPHCHALNRSKQVGDSVSGVSGTISPNLGVSGTITPNLGVSGTGVSGTITPNLGASGTITPNLGSATALSDVDLAKQVSGSIPDKIPASASGSPVAAQVEADGDNIVSSAINS